MSDELVVLGTVVPMDVITLPLHTARTTIRGLRAEDADALTAYRNDPEVARYQAWSLPYDVEDARRMIAELVDASGPVPGRVLQFAVEHREALVGDLFVRLDEPGTTATIGYTFARNAQGRGLATEATAALVDALFSAGVHRITATVDPDNSPSAALLERLGFRYEGRAVKAAFVRGEWLDDDCYAQLSEERVA